MSWRAWRREDCVRRGFAAGYRAALATLVALVDAPRTFVGIVCVRLDSLAHVKQPSGGGRRQLCRAAFLGFLQADLHLSAEARDAGEARLTAGFLLFAQLAPQLIRAARLRP